MTNNNWEELGTLYGQKLYIEKGKHTEDARRFIEAKKDEFLAWIPPELFESAKFQERKELIDDIQTWVKENSGWEDYGSGYTTGDNSGLVDVRELITHLNSIK